MSRPWTRPGDAAAVLRRRWDSGALLTAFLDGQEWTPVSIPLRRPSAADIGEELGAVQEWAAEWEQPGRGPLSVEYTRVGGRRTGASTIPCRARVDSYDQAWTLLGVHEEAGRMADLAHATRLACPRLHPWLVAHPMRALRLQDRWEKLLATVTWIDEHQAPDMYLRQVDIPGVDTKFIERHRGVLAELLDLQLSPGRIDTEASGFEDRYGFLGKPGYVRFRCGSLNGFSELSVRKDEFRAPPPGVTRAYAVENEITYLAVPCPPGAMVIWGQGYAVPVIEPLTWLRSLDLVYWGDIDTHGFAILNRLRRHFPHARSMLMDRPTLLAHRDQWVTEEKPTDAQLDRLGTEESALYADLVSGLLGPSVRLEQERIRFAAITACLRA
jgi:hypothetical protein